MADGTQVPCTRCVAKNLVCQTRAPQRGPSRSSFTNKPTTYEIPVPPASPRSGSASADVTPGIVTPTHGDGIFMNWNHAIGHRFSAPPVGFKPPDAAIHDDDFTQFALDDCNYFGPSSANSTMLPNLFPTSDPFDFASPSAWPWPASLKPDLLELSPWDMALHASLDVLAHGTGVSERTNSLLSADSSSRTSLPSLDMAPVTDQEQFQALEGWPLFQCNPITPLSACPSTAAQHVKNLAILLKDGKMAMDRRLEHDSSVPVEPLLASIREQLNSVLQELFNGVQRLYGIQDHRDNGIFDWVGVSILVLPTPRILDFYLRAYASCCEPYYPFVPTTTLKINDLAEGGNVTLPGVVMLLMLAAGAMTCSASEPHGQFTHGLLEICSVSLRKLMEQNIKLVSDLEVSQCALLLIMVAAWSGDKWQMDAAIYQKTMFLEMHVKTEAHGHRGAHSESSIELVQGRDSWKEQENANRITYSWLILDHEICLFHDATSTSFFSISSLNKPVPSLEPSCTAQFAGTRGQDPAYGDRADASLPWSLSEWVSWFKETNDVRSSTTAVSAFTLRLLLCHLQDETTRLRFAVDATPTVRQSHRGLRHSSRVLLSVQVLEIQELLHIWYDLAKASAGQTDTASSPAMAANLALYHLVTLNTLVSFSAIERAARASSKDVHGASHPRCWKRAYHLENPREIFFHCGQVLRNICSVPEASRPAWHAAAIYRVALIAWATSKCHYVPDIDLRMDIQDTLFLDMLSPEHPTVVAFLHQEGAQAAFCDANGTATGMEDAEGVLRHCARALNTDGRAKTRFALGIQKKLETLAQRWDNAAIRV